MTTKVEAMARLYWKRMAETEPRVVVPSPVVLTEPIHTSLLQHVTNPIQTWCRNPHNWKHMLHYQLPLDNNTHADVYLYVGHQPARPHVHKIIRYVYWWLLLAFPETPSHCRQSFRLFLYLTPFLKTLPPRHQPLREIHVNTGMTISCTTAQAGQDIIVYRWEEWFKVTIHETIHMWGLDDSPDTPWDKHLGHVIQSITGLQQPHGADFGVYEAYTETWAEFLHVVFRSYEAKKKRLALFRKLLRQEQTHSQQQTRKIAKHTFDPQMKLHSYYPLKTHILTHLDDFFIHCSNVNGHTTPLRKNKTQTAKHKYEQWWRNTLPPTTTTTTTTQSGGHVDSLRMSSTDIQFTQP